MTMKTQPDNQSTVDPNRIGSRMNRIDPDIFRSQSNAESETGDDEPVETEENVFSDEPIDKDGNPTDGSDYSLNDGQPER